MRCKKSRWLLLALIAANSCNGPKFLGQSKNGEEKRTPIAANAAPEHAATAGGEVHVRPTPMAEPTKQPLIISTPGTRPQERVTPLNSQPVMTPTVGIETGVGTPSAQITPRHMPSPLQTPQPGLEGLQVPTPQNSVTANVGGPAPEPVFPIPTIVPGMPGTPLIVETSGDNSITAADTTVYFDLDADGVAERLAWVLSGASWIAFDWNGDGRINDGGELFGSSTKLANGKVACDGLEALRQFDSNGDGVVDSSDKDFQRLILWNDANLNGVSEPPEISQFSGKFSSISLQMRRASTPISFNGWGVWELLRGSAKLLNGKEAVVLDVLLEAK